MEQKPDPNTRPVCKDVLAVIFKVVTTPVTTALKSDNIIAPGAYRFRWCLGGVLVCSPKETEQVNAIRIHSI